MTLAPASQVIQDRLLLYGQEWKRVSRDLWARPDIRDLYPEMLKVSYQVIRASTPLLTLARDCAKELAATDPVAASLAPYLTRHEQEERGHDGWLLEDLNRLGIREEEALESLPSPPVAGMVGAQHYWVRHTHPVAILGYLAVLEGEPPEEAFFIEAAKRCGLDEAAFSTLRYHARVDRQHWQEMLDLFDALPLEPRHLALIGLSILHTCEGMAASMKGLLARPMAR